MAIKEEILKLKDGECYIVPESDYGKAEIWLKNNVYFLFSIPQYGGQPQFETIFKRYEIDRMVEMINSWS